jgi:hypothetical protein
MATRTDLAKAAAVFRDAFTYDPGHSDLDNEQPITIRVTLGDWRKLDYALNAQDGPNDEQLQAARRWGALMLMDPMDIVTVAMGAPTDEEFMGKMEERCDRLLASIGLSPATTCSPTVNENGR